MKKLIIVTILLVFTLVLASCSSTDKLDQEYKASSADLEKYSGTDVANVIKVTQQKIDKAVEDKLNVYAPRHLKRSKVLLKEATDLIYSKDDESLLSKLAILKKKLTKEEKKKLFYSKIALSRRYIKNGYQVKTIVEKELKTVFALRDSIIKLKGDKEFSDDFEDLTERIKTIMMKVEEKKSKYTFSTRNELITDLKALKAKLVIKYSLAETRKVISKTKKKEFNLIAVKTYKKAVKTYNSSVEFIKKHTEDEKGVEDAASQALFAANHAWFVALEMKKLARVIGGMNQNSIPKLESIVLDQENHLKYIGEALKAKDVRDRSLSDQATEIAKVATALIKKNKMLQDKPALQKKEMREPASPSTPSGEMAKVESDSEEKSQ